MVAKTSITVLDLRRVKQIEVLIASESELSTLILKDICKLKVVKVDDTPLKALHTHFMPELESLSIQETGIHYLDLRNNNKLTTLHFGVG